MSESVDNLEGLYPIKIIGIGDVGIKFVQHILNSGFIGVQFACVDTELQKLNKSSASVKILIEENFVRSLCSNVDTEVGYKVAIGQINKIRDFIGDADMVFVVAGMGEGTITGTVRVVAEIAKEMGALTVGVVTTPLSSEGSEGVQTTEAGLENLTSFVDCLISIPNDSAITYMYNAVKAITDILNAPGLICTDLEDVRTVLSGSGLAIMGTGVASGKDRAREATQIAISSFKGDFSLKRANSIVYSFTTNEDGGINELLEVGKIIRDAASEEANIIFGYPYDENMVDELRVTIIATDFKLHVE